MSRKWRKEGAKFEQMKFEFEQEISEEEKQRLRIFAPITWNTIPKLGVTIMDIPQDRILEATNLVENHFLNESLLTVNGKVLCEQESKEFFRKRIEVDLNYRQSIMAINNATENRDIIAVLILKALKKRDNEQKFGMVQVIHGAALKKVVHFRNTLKRKIDIYEHFNIDIFLEYSLLCVHSAYRHRGIGFELMKCGIGVAKSLGCPAVCGIMETRKQQDLARSIGMDVLRSTNYLDWKNDFGTVMFPWPGPANFFCALMGGLIKVTERPRSPPDKIRELRNRLERSIAEEPPTRMQRLADMKKEREKQERKITTAAAIAARRKALM